MTPSARLAAAIELLEEIIVAARTRGGAADTLAKRYFGTRRYIGSKDRRAIRELTWQAIRSCPDIPLNGRAVFAALADKDPEIASLFDGSGYGPAPLSTDEPRARLGTGAPEAVARELYPFLDQDELAALTQRAPVDIRLNMSAAMSGPLPEGGEPLPAPLHGRRYLVDTPLEHHDAYEAGAFEIQDAGSQWIAHACRVQPAMVVIDLCAGAGGETLALADQLMGSGEVLACDTDRRRLSQLTPRAERARLANIKTLLLNPRQEAAMLEPWRNRADVVLVDAPCSGSGTWRRNPEARWRANPAVIRRFAEEQSRLLQIAADLVVPGGALVYAVCALSVAEGTGVLEQFLLSRPDWVAVDLHDGALPAHVGRRVGRGIVLTPLHDQTDGFFFARLQAP